MPSQGIDGPFVSYSLNFEDVILHRLFPTQKQGFYVDVGAGHPKFENDTYALYKRGWTGINIEPNQGFFELLKQERPHDRSLCMLLTDTVDEPLIYHEIENSGLSTCDDALARQHAAQGYVLRTRRVQAGTLADVLSDYGIRFVDVLKVDVEGFEERVLNGNDWERFRPSVVLVEATYPNSPERRPTNIRGFLEQRGYRHILFDGLNDFYLENNFPCPDGATLPPNVFDRFVPHQIDDLRREVALLQTDVAGKQRAFASLQVEQQELAFENQRLHGATAQMRTELQTLNRFLEPLHALQELLDAHSAETVWANKQLVATQERLEQQAAEARQANLMLQSIYTSRSWRLTKPWRFTGTLIKTLARRATAR